MLTLFEKPSIVTANINPLLKSVWKFLSSTLKSTTFAWRIDSSGTSTTYPTVHRILRINWSSMFLFYADNSTSTRSSWSKSPIKSENSSNSTGKAKPKSTIIPSEEEDRKTPCFKSKSPPETSSACPGTWKKTFNYPQ